jgi:hypothetical protein
MKHNMNTEEKTGYETISPDPSERVVFSSPSQSIEIVNSEICDLDLFVAALRGQAKHGSLAESLRFLYLESSGDRDVLLMHENRDDKDWIEAYKAVYWFSAGWLDSDFYKNK